MANLRWAIVSMLAIGVSAHAADVKVVRAQVFDADSHRSKLLFNMIREERTDGDKTTVTETFADPQGNEALRSVTLLDHGRFVRYDLQQKQLNESAKIEARDGKLFFEYTEKSGKTKKSDEDLKDNFVLSPIMGRYIQAHWNELVNGKDIDMRFGVPERRETVGFKIFKDDEKKIDGHDVLIAKMKPTSFVIAALVKPLFFLFR